MHNHGKQCRSWWDCSRRVVSFRSTFFAQVSGFVCRTKRVTVIDLDQEIKHFFMNAYVRKFKWLPSNEELIHPKEVTPVKKYLPLFLLGDTLKRIKMLPPKANSFFADKPTLLETFEYFETKSCLQKLSSLASWRRNLKVYILTLM